MSAQRQRLARGALWTAIVGGSLVVAPGARVGDSLYAEYQPKSLVVLVAIALFAVLAAGAPRVAVTTRAVRIARAAALALAGLCALSFAATVSGGWLFPAESLVRIVLPLAFAVAVTSSLELADSVETALVHAAVALSVLALAEVFEVVLLLLPEEARPGATMVHRNNVAFQVALALPFVVVRLFRGGAPRLRDLATLMLLLAGLMVCRCRTAWLGTLAAAAVLAVAAARSNPAAARRRWPLIAGAVTVSALTVVALPQARGIERLPARLSQTLNLADPAMRERYAIFWDALTMVREHPLLGWGAGMFGHRRREAVGARDQFTIDPEWSVAPRARVAVFGTEAGPPSLYQLRRDDNVPAVTPLRPSPWPLRPTVSPDGRFIAFHEMVPRWGANGEHRLSIVSSRGGDARTLVRTGRDVFVARAAFSPDAARLVYERVEHDSSGWRTRLRIVERDGSGDRPLMRGDELDARGISFRSDGASVYTSAGNCLYEVALADGHARKVGCPDLPLWGAPADAPALSPDNHALAVAAGNPACPKVFVTAVDVERWTLVSGAACATRPIWLGDGSGRLAFIAGAGDAGRIVTVAADGAGARTLDYAPPRINRLAPDGDGILALAGVRGDDGAARALVRVPLAGGSVDTLLAPFAATAPPWADHPHFDLLAVAVESGVPAALAALAGAVALALALVGAGRRRAADVAACAAALVCFVILGLTNAPLALAPSAASLWLIAAVAAQATRSANAQGQKT